MSVEMNTVYVNVISFKGICDDAEHYYIKIDGEDLKYKLSENQANYLNKKDPSFKYNEGDETNRFFNEYQGISTAIKKVKAMKNIDTIIVTDRMRLRYEIVLNHRILRNYWDSLQVKDNKSV